MIFVLTGATVRKSHTETQWIPETKVIQNQCFHRFNFALLIIVDVVSEWRSGRWLGCYTATLDWWWWWWATFLHTNISPAHRRHFIKTSLPAPAWSPSHHILTPWQWRGSSRSDQARLLMSSWCRRDNVIINTLGLIRTRFSQWFSLVVVVRDYSLSVKPI